MIEQQRKILVEIEVNNTKESSHFNSSNLLNMKFIDKEACTYTIKKIYPNGFDGFKDDLLNLFKEKLSLQI